MVAENIYAGRGKRKLLFYPRYKDRVIPLILCLGGFGQDRLEEKEREGREEVNVFGWAFIALSWGSIVFLMVLCFRKVFSKEEIK